MATRRNINESEDNPFAMSIGDLMAGLLFIFILLLTATMLKVQTKSDKEAAITQEYDRVNTQLYIDLQEEFKDSLKVWNAEIDSIQLSVRFQEPSTLFDFAKDDLKPRFKSILNDFFPRYIALLNDPRYRDDIEEIRIEGHTDSSGEYFTNMKLSQDRTRTVLEYCFNLLDDSKKDWAMSKATANGLSYSHIIKNPDGTENSTRSRRVEFRIRTNAEQKLEEIARNRNGQ
jgi:outer membrane protein OmpA-like peptidoglycan-associated protein